MSRSLDDLRPEMKVKAEEVVHICAERGIDLLIYCTLRTLTEQEELFRRGRNVYAFNAKISSFENKGFPDLADMIRDRKGAPGPIVTNAAPGESWHNYGLAFDAVPLVNGKAMWDSRRPEWRVYGDIVNSVGLFWAGDWLTFRELPHAQFYEARNPLTQYSPETIRQMLGIV